MWHMQMTTPRWTESLHILPQYSMLKATGGYEIFIEARAISPTLFTVHRKVNKELERYHGTGDSGWFDWNVAQDLARQWFDLFVDGTFRDKIAHHTSAVSWHNEIWADSQNDIEVAERIAAAEAAVTVWNHEYRSTFDNDIRLIIGEAPPGNGMPREIGALAIETDNVVGYHPYEWWRRGVRSPLEHGSFNRRMTSLRFDTLEKEWGLSPVWAFTECGPIESAVTGWRAPECLGGDRDKYVEAVRLFIEDVSTTNAYKQNRIKGFSLFTTFSPGDEQWATFHTQQPEMNMLAEMIRDNWKPGTDPVTPPPPIDISDFHKKAWAVTVQKQVTGDGGLRLNRDAGIQGRINHDNLSGLQLQIVTDEVIVDGRTVQAAESLTNAVPRRVYVWEPGKDIYYFEDG